jgi:uncharacterized membrane protein YwzB
MTSETDSSHLPSIHRTSQFHAYFDTSIRSDKNEQIPQASPPAYTVVPVPSSDNNTENTRLVNNPADVLNQFVNQRSSSLIQRQPNSEQILRINQYIDNQEKKINNKLAAALCLSIVAIVLGSTGIGFFIVYHNESCSPNQTSSYCNRTYWALSLGCLSIFLGILRIALYYLMKMKIKRIKKTWHTKIGQLQHTSVPDY